MNRFILEIHKKAGWVVGDITAVEDVTQTEPVVKSKKWRRVKRAKTIEQFLDHAVAKVGSPSIIIEHIFFNLDN